MEIRQDMQVMGERRALLRAQFVDAAQDHVMGAAAERSPFGRPIQEVIEQGAGGRLPAFVEPQTRRDCAEIRTPYARHEARLAR